MSRCRKYTIDETFFDNWNEPMAYVLGFWFADGYMKKEKSYRIIFSSADQEILLQIQAAFRATHRVLVSRGAWELTLYSKRLFVQLTELGGFRAKSKTITFPKIPQLYLRDFIRGYFDGDGSVFYVTYISTKNHKPRTELRSNFTSGSVLFLESLMDILGKELGFSKKMLGIYNEGRSLKLGYGMSDTKKLLAFMYHPGFTIGLKRKAAFALAMQ